MPVYKPRFFPNVASFRLLLSVSNIPRSHGPFWTVFVQNPALLHRIDAWGAGISVAFLFGFMWNPGIIGISPGGVWTLGGSALGLFLVSVFRFARNPAFFLRDLGLLNVGYFFLSLGVLTPRFSQLTPWGIGYFSVELSLVLGLAWVEFQVWKSLSSQSKQGFKT